MNAWLQGLNPRERALVLGAMVVVGLIGAYVFVAEPLWARLVEQRERLESQRALLAWMQDSAAEVQRLRPSATAAETSTKAPYLVLDEAVRRTGLPAPARLEPRGRDGTLAQFENVPFNRLIAMLADVERRGNLTVTEVSVTRRDGGAVNASVSLSRTP